MWVWDRLCNSYIEDKIWYFSEPHKAVNMFVDASDGVATEAFLSHKLLQTEEVDHYKLQILYYLKVTLHVFTI